MYRNYSPESTYTTFPLGYVQYCTGWWLHMGWAAQGRSMRTRQVRTLGPPDGKRLPRVPIPIQPISSPSPRSAPLMPLRPSLYHASEAGTRRPLFNLYPARCFPSLITGPCLIFLPEQIALCPPDHCCQGRAAVPPSMPAAALLPIAAAAAAILFPVAGRLSLSNPQSIKPFCINVCGALFRHVSLLASSALETLGLARLASPTPSKAPPNLSKPNTP